MTIESKTIRAESHETLGAIIHRDTGLIVEQWARRAVEEQPSAQRVHHHALLDHLPSFLQALGESLAESDEAETDKHCRPARKHGEQRWEAGWSLTEVVQDYQILRLVLVVHLEESLDRPLRSREIMALGLALDEAISASVQAFVREREERDRKADEALKQHAAALREANERKDQFLAILGHEMRNPLAPLRNALQVLGLQASDPATVEWARSLMERQVLLMTRLVDDLLDVTRISRSKITLRRERVDLARLLRDTVEDRRGSATEAGLVLSLQSPPDPVWVDGDQSRLSQVVGNLLQNAIKFTDRGGQITVRLGIEEDGRRARVAVHDTGIGIEPGLLPQIFQTYMQADRSLERSRGGLGLGLALVKGLVELHGGEVRAVSEGNGKGAEFTFWLPTVAAPKPTAAPPASVPVPVSPLRILLIEDNRDSAVSLKVLLEHDGHTVSIAHSGPDGIDTAKREKPDVVLCDLGLPGMNGYAVATALRGEPVTASIRLIAVSGHGSEADQERCRQAGFDLHLTKPVAPEVLQERLAALRQDS